MSTFADSSALVKLYADEPGREVIRELTTVVVAQLGRVEVPAALWRKHRLGELDADDAQALTAEFEADYFGTDDEVPRFVTVRIAPSILDEAARLVAARGLRAHDAMQLASAIATREADERCAAFAAFDHTLRAAAAAEGFALVPPGP